MEARRASRGAAPRALLKRATAGSATFAATPACYLFVLRDLRAPMSPKTRRRWVLSHRWAGAGWCAPVTIGAETLRWSSGSSVAREGPQRE
jgi:hypothetical protein